MCLLLLSVLNWNLEMSNFFAPCQVTLAEHDADTHFQSFSLSLCAGFVVFLRGCSIAQLSGVSSGGEKAKMTSVASEFEHMDIQQQFNDGVNNRWDTDEWDNENSSARLFERSRIKALAGRRGQGQIGWKCWVSSGCVWLFACVSCYCEEEVICVWQHLCLMDQ